MRLFDIRSLLVLAVVAATSSALLGCPDKANPDPAAGKDAGAPTAAKAAAPGVSAAAPAKSGGW